MTARGFAGTAVTAACVVWAAGLAEAKMGSREEAWAAIRERSAFLKENVATFALTLTPLVASDKPYYALVLNCVPFEADASEPFFQRASISTNAAIALIEHLAASGFLAGAQEGVSATRPDRLAPEGYWLDVTAGGDRPRTFGMSLGWGLNTVLELEALRDAARGEAEAAKGFEFLLGRLSGLKAVWERERAEREKEAAAQAEAERLERLASVALTVSLSEDRRTVVARRDGQEVWQVRLSEPADHAAIAPPDRVVVQPGNRVFDLLDGKQRRE